MDRLVYTALSGMQASMNRQRVIASNMANAQTIGVRAEQVDQRPVTLQGAGRDAKCLREGEQVVDVAAALSAFDAGQHRVGHWPAKGGDASGQLSLGEAALGAENFDRAGGPYPGCADFQ